MGDDEGRAPRAQSEGGEEDRRQSPDLFEEIEPAPHPDAPDPEEFDAIADEVVAPETTPGIIESIADDSTPKLPFPDDDDESGMTAAPQPDLPPRDELLHSYAADGETATDGAPSEDPGVVEDPDPDNDQPEVDDHEDRRRFAFQNDEFAELVAAESSGIEARTLMIVGGVVVTIFAVVLGYLYLQGGEPPTEDDVPLVEAPEGPAKIEPEDRGGMEVADQEKLVFDRMSGTETPMDEKMASIPEEPVDLPAAVGEPDDAAPETTPDQLPDAAEAGDQSAPSPAATVFEPAPAKPGAFMIQLGAFGSDSGARTAWDDMHGRYSSILSGLAPRVEAADLGPRGTLHRLKAGPFDTRAEADTVCRALKSAGRDCLVAAN